MIEVRPATGDDAAVLSRVLCASITQLCSRDHRNDPEILALWTANKTPEIIRSWIEDPSLQLFVAMRDGAVAGVGCINAQGEVVLNYVSPAHRYCGVSKAVMERLEETLAEFGIPKGTLQSTGTALRFYLSAGWKRSGDPIEKHGMAGYPMEKEISISRSE